MAFKILNEEQIALLTENQKQQYEKELDIYKERSAFVERMHILENTEIPPYEPKLQSIAVIGKVPEKVIGRQEYTVKRCVPLKKPELAFRVPEFQEPIDMVLLPESKKAVPVIMKQMPLFSETSAPDIPDRVVLDVPDMSFTAPQMAEPLLPEVAVSITDVRQFHKAENPEIKLPAALKPNISVKVKKVETEQAVLPELVKIEPVSADYEMPEISAVKFQPIAKIEPVSADYEMPEISAAKFQPIVKIEPVNAEFTKPEIQKAEMPAVSKAEPVNADFEIPEISAAELRPVAKIEPVNVRFEKPELSISGFPEVSKPSTSVRNIVSMKQPAVDLPSIGKISVIERKMKPVERREIQITAAPIKIVVVRSFAGIESKAEGLPNKAAVHIPNAYEALRELLPLIKEPGVLEEVSS